MPRYCAARSRARKHSRQGSNLQHAVLETAALPLELPEYKSRPRNRTSRVYTHAPRSKLRSGGHIKTAPVRRRGCWLAHILSGKLHLGKDSKAFSWHGRLHVRPCGLSSPCAIWCEAADLHRTGLSLNRCDASHRSSAKREESKAQYLQTEKEENAKKGHVSEAACIGLPLAFPMIQFYTMR